MSPRVDFYSERKVWVKRSRYGKEYAKGFMSFIYKAEDAALQKTLDRYSAVFIEALEYFGERLRESFEEQSTQR